MARKEFVLAMVAVISAVFCTMVFGDADASRRDAGSYKEGFATEDFESGRYLQGDPNAQWIVRVFVSS